MKKMNYIDLPLYEQGLSEEELKKVEEQSKKDEEYIKRTGKWPPIE